MKVLNIMLTNTLGGIEQSFLDYSQALLVNHHQVISVVQPLSPIIKYIVKNGFDYHCLRVWSYYDYLAAFKLKYFIKKNNVDIVIAHGGRAARIAQLLNLSVPVISVSHNSNFKKILHCDAIIAITNKMRKDIIKSGYPEKSCYRLYNTVSQEIKNIRSFSYHKPPIIGFLGRLDKGKGIDDLLYAVRLIVDSGLSLKVIIGGEGAEKENLIKLSEESGLGKVIKFVAWVDDKKSFYQAIDILVLPSLNESFGIVILEAFAYNKVVISTKTDGPSEIITNGKNGLLAEISNPVDLADKISCVLLDQKLGNKLIKSGNDRVRDFSMLSFSKQLDFIINDVFCKKV
jgi:glycosyltransferase involved in cell wall biosynthesis